MFTTPIAQATYCANPDLVEECIKICAAADVSAIGLRLGSYLQAIAFFVLVLVAPDEGGAEALWLSLSVSYAFILTNYVQLYLGSITLHHTIVVITLSTLPYIATLAGMNSLTSYRGLGARGMLVLQFGLLVKAILTAILWGFCLYAWFEGQLPESTHLMFRQPHCLDSTAIVAFFVPLRSDDAEHYSRSRALLILYTILWAVLLTVGSYWTFKAPIVLRRRGGHFRPKLQRGKRDERFFSTPEQREARRKKRAKMAEDPADYTPSSSEGDDLMIATMRILAASPTTGFLSADPVWANSGPARTPQQASAAWTEREIESRHHFIIWPIVAILLTFSILTTELQIAMNDIYAGEMHWDFPGTLTFILALPTVWSVIKAILRIREGRRPTPTQRSDETFLQLGHQNARISRRAARREREELALLSSSGHSDGDRFDLRPKRTASTRSQSSTGSRSRSKR
ncbi:hypothetical protein BCR35DRAFT_328668 [Leucosporidium creatinivorum]|uniref:Uncharacterized protein n=1 Tax=Leucosporidium creatinivorum TaxID=106004 RepID=A0A1Y2G1Z4_9BASI|nr:hypothetical protein BCR35DRAFT_328668 [Leucosporidium creatinivorum]